MAARMSFSYPEEMKDKLTMLAKKDCRSLSGYIQKVLYEHLKTKGVGIKNPLKQRRNKK